MIKGKASRRDLAVNWWWTWVGNLAGSVLLAWMAVRAGVLDPAPIKDFILALTAVKMNLPVDQLFLRAILANWLVCLAVWMVTRATSEPAKLVLIWWCMFTFITLGFEHSVANMCGLMLGLLLPHDGVAGITWLGYAYNLGVVTLGNVVGGAGFVAGLYWVGSRRPASASPKPAGPTLTASTEGPAAQPVVIVPALATAAAR